MKTTSSASISKRLVFVTGDKGGVGKSFTARTLVQHNLDTEQACHAYDIDPVNPTPAPVLSRKHYSSRIWRNPVPSTKSATISNSIHFSWSIVPPGRFTNSMGGFGSSGLFRQRQDLHLGRHLCLCHHTRQKLHRASCPKRSKCSATKPIISSSKTSKWGKTSRFMKTPS